MKRKLLRVFVSFGVVLCLSANIVFAYSANRCGAYGYDHSYARVVEPNDPEDECPGGAWSNLP